MTKSKPAAPAGRRAPKRAAGQASHPAQTQRKLASTPIHVRWRDLDAFNHVNNASYFTYLEEARMQWLRTIEGEWFNEHSMPVVVAIEMHYRTAITWPAEIVIETTCDRVGNTSITLREEIVDARDHKRIYADGSVVVVWIDPSSNTSVPLPRAIRDACG
jgi:acyl-CoA thioester hydrolase